MKSVLYDMIYVIHGIAGNDNHSAVIGAVEATSPAEVKQAFRKFEQTYPEVRGQINRTVFNKFASESGLKIVPIVGIDLNVLSL